MSVAAPAAPLTESLTDDQQVAALAEQLDGYTESQELDAGVENLQPDSELEDGVEWITPQVAFTAAKAGLELEDIEGLGSLGAFEQALNLLSGRAPNVEAKPQPLAESPNLLDDLSLPAELTQESLNELLGEDAAKPMGQLLDFVKKLAAQNAELRKQITPLTSLQQRFQQEQITQSNAWIDDQFSKLGQDTVSLFGKGSFHNVQKQEPLLKNRVKLLKAMEVYQQMNPEETRDEAFQKAFAIAFPKEASSVLNKQQTNSLRQQASRKIGSSQSRTTPKLGVDPAVAKVQSQLDAYRLENGDI
jgi:hypothetical protein